MARLAQNYYVDEVYLDKRNRLITLKPEWIQKLEMIDKIPKVVDNLTSTSKTDALSANMWRKLKQLIDQWGWWWWWVDFSDKCMEEEDYEALPDSKYTDWQLYLIYSEKVIV